MTHFYIKDDTDLNQDGCFVYTILDDSKPQWMIRLSMVGRYGVLFRIDGSRPSLFKADTELTPREELIFKLVAKHEIVLVDEETLMAPVALAARGFSESFRQNM